jgi:hypothetical protein
VHEVNATSITPSLVLIQKGCSQNFILTFASGTLVYGTNYFIRLITAKGTCIVDSLLYNSTNTSDYNSQKDYYTSPAPNQETAQVSWQSLNGLRDAALVFSLLMAIFVVFHFVNWYNNKSSRKINREIVK